ncbi:MurT ligase domain-containing protein [Adlercreutzia sp. R21]|uniref:MurT ligase domain-containing protein n=1 Tax=Adlercreutzia wanghongyangiae TaxID=3111451 RepID=UPI002DBF235D|nr:MurT ligase domain-containing protein [Adlercreutzia sp. R21]MEC4184854.1 MurT ligase domain-containing protein [Adlercreutzia sp. R21]
MSVRFTLAKAVGGVTTWGLKHVAHRPAASLPGKMALKVDPSLLRDLRGRCTEGMLITVGTNGKTSTNNILADAFEAAGCTVACNRTGANLVAGVSSALLQAKHPQWGIIECDELSLARVLPSLQATYVLLLNLFRDQLDRCGEIDRIQESIAGALTASPDTVLIYNGDDPLCAAIAASVQNRSVAFGLAESMGLAQNTVTDAQMCQQCNGMVQYRFRQYGQLGDYYCEQCDFARPPLTYAGRSIALNADGVTMEACGPTACEPLHTPQATPYAAYNLIAAYAACCEAGIPTPVLQRVVDDFDPQNGRLQHYAIGGHKVLLNLAKNPTGFNQNLKIVEVDEGPKMVAFFVNDNAVDGRDISWIWDIDFEELAGQLNTVVFAGGTRAHDVAVRLKYAGINAEVVDGIEDAFARMDGLIVEGRLPVEAAVYAIANYTALPPVHSALNAMAAGETAPRVSAAPSHADDAAELSSPCHPERSAEGAESKDPASASTPGETPVVIAHMLPDLLNLYGDGGNVRILEQRLRWRGIPVEVRRVSYGESVDFSEVDLVFMGGGPDREQKLASEQLLGMAADLAAYVEADGPLLAICGGYQILGRQWLWGDELVPGLGIIDMETRRPGTSANRLIGNLMLQSSLTERPVIGYENHAGRTYLDEGVQPFGRIVGKAGFGNNDDDGVEGVRYRNVVGTYSHGPLLSKNPAVADWLLARALEHRTARTGVPLPSLAPLDDAAELAANEAMVRRLA